MQISGFFKSLFRWQPTRETLIPTVAGLVVIFLSWTLLFTRSLPWLAIFIHDELLILLVGILFPLWYIRRTGSDFAAFGLSFKRWSLYLSINLLLGGLLLLLFLNESPPPPDFRLTASVGWQAFYVMLAGIFEVIFFYSFQRTLFERAFGVGPAILLTAGFYALHHIGFQPEYAKLFPVGLIYAVTFRLGNSALLIYPFFWGVGGCYDVLVQSQVVTEIIYPAGRSLILVLLLTAAVFWTVHSRKEGGAMTRTQSY